MGMSANDARKRWREQMKQEKRCQNCGKQDEKTLAGRSRCAECAIKDNLRDKERLDASPDKRAKKAADQRNWRRQLRQNCLCVDCKKQDAYTLNGRARCFECAEKNARGYRERRAKAPDAFNKAQRELRAKWRENGKCTNCGREKPPWDHHNVCMICRVKMYGLKKRKREARDDWFPRGTPGLCYFCLQPAMEGKKVCKRCYDARLPGLEKAREVSRTRNGNHIWKKYNEILFRRMKRQ